MNNLVSSAQKIKTKGNQIKRDLTTCNAKIKKQKKNEEGHLKYSSNQM